MLSLFILYGWHPTALAGEHEALSELDSLSIKCLKTRDRSICRRALFHAEVLQHQAALHGNYACQSRLLGLEADLLMISFKNVRRESLMAMLQASKKFCKSL